jgi:uncharacterized protein YPO0396
LDAVRKKIDGKENSRTDRENKRGALNSTRSAYEEELGECTQTVSTVTLEEQGKFSPKIQEFLGQQEFTVKTIDRLREESRKRIEAAREEKAKAEKKLQGGVISKMQKYKNEYPAETLEVDASIEAIPEFKAFLRKIEEEDLPRHESRFKELLNQGTINDIAIFKNQLETFAKDIEDKIRQINRSLKEIEYNPGTYIELIADKSPDIDVRDFKTQLRNCLENVLGDTDLYNEEKFNKVKLILDRFNSGIPADIGWTAKVTDVRNWFTFSASERWIADSTEREFYSDSSGKSGGQKEKLAYTILASALAYQFGLEWNRTKSRSFRFVALDEAFGRGSDESTRYGLELFKKLNLQLLIVTPLQKINIIETAVIPLSGTSP